MPSNPPLSCTATSNPLPVCSREAIRLASEKTSRLCAMAASIDAGSSRPPRWMQACADSGGADVPWALTPRRRNCATRAAPIAWSPITQTRSPETRPGSAKPVAAAAIGSTT